MCGFSIVIDRTGAQVDPAMLHRMNEVVSHRGPNADGVSVRGQVGLGHRRLSIIDLASHANQPMLRDESSLAYNGEIYNFQDVRAELEALGVAFSTNSDTEVLIQALRTWWTDALPRLNGMFSFAYHDARTGRVLLARDRFGVKPLVYRLEKDQIIAGSEAKQLFAADGAAAQLNDEAAVRFLLDARLNIDNQTFFRGVTELRGGCYAVYDCADDSFHIDRWYDLAARVQRSSAPYDAAREQTSVILHDAVRIRHIANVPLGACLSGGVDSSVICSISAGLVEDPSAFKVFTSFHQHEGYDERVYSRKVVETFGFHSIEVEPDLGVLFTPQTMQDLAWGQDQPLGSGSHFNEYMIFKTAREAGVTVVLDGQGADEYFGGYGEFWHAAQMEHLRTLNLAAFQRGIALRAESTGRSNAEITKRFAASLLPRKLVETPGWITEARRYGPAAATPASATSFNALAIEEVLSTSLPYQLHSEDRHSMRWSIEARMPMTDYRLVEQALSLPTEYKVGRGYQKRILRDAAPELPREIATRRGKMGFVSADGEFMRRHAGAIRPMMAAAADYASRFVPAKRVMEDFDAMAAGKLAYHDGFFRLLSFHGWGKAFNVTP
jgi:asparagine synthase (glutamine-hydrolysing)